MNAIQLALLAAVFWGMATVFDKLGVRGISAPLAVAVRSLFVGAVMLVYLLIAGQARELMQIKGYTFVFLALSAICAGLVGQALYFAAMQRGQASTVVPIVGSYPLAAAVLGVMVFRESITPAKVLGVLLVVGGVALLGSQR